MKLKKLIIISLLLLFFLIIGSSFANENVTMEVNDIPEIDDSTPSIYITKDNREYDGVINDMEVSVKSVDKDNAYSKQAKIKIKPLSNNYGSLKCDNIYMDKNSDGVYSGSSNSYPTIIKITDGYYKTLFKVYHYPNNSLNEIIHPDNLYRLTPKGEIYYGDVKVGNFDFGTKYKSKLYISSTNTFELETNPYIIKPATDNAFYSLYQNEKVLNPFLRLNDNEKFASFSSEDGWFKIDIYNEIYDYKTVKNPIYIYKKVKNGYKWKYYKTKWHKTKIVTRVFKKGKFIFYNSNIEKIRKLLNKNGKIIKTVDSGKKKTVYMKYPVDYYKKVRKYKYVRKVKKYTYNKEFVGSHYEFDKSENRYYGDYTPIKSQSTAMG